MLVLRGKRLIWLAASAICHTVWLRAQTAPNAAAPGVSPISVSPISIVEAGQTTINLNPQIAISREQVNFDRGALLIQQGIFDLNLTSSVSDSRAYTGLLPGLSVDGQNPMITDTVTTSGGASQLYRSGITVAPFIELNRISDNQTMQVGANQPLVSIEVTLPLLRNRGRAAVASREIAAGLEVDASAYDLSQVASQALANTATAYWNYVGAIQSLDVYRQSEDRGKALLEGVEAQASADIVPRIQVQDAVANLANRTQARIGQEQAVIQAQQQLAIAMGLDDHHMITIAPPGDPLPGGGSLPSVQLDAVHLQQYIDQALTRRGDYLASKTRAGEQRALLAGNKNQLLPQVNVVGSLGYTGVRPGSGPGNYIAPLFITPSGPNASVGLQYQFPLQNRAAKGGVAQNEAMLRQQDLTTNDLARQIASAVVTAASALRLNALQLVEARRASAAALAGLDGERERLRSGVGSVLDTLQTEDRYIAAVLAEISAQVSYATAIAGFRFATGTFIDPRSPVQAVAREAFYAPTPP